MKGLIFDTYDRDTVITMSDFYSKYFKSLIYKPSIVLSFHVNELKKLLYRIRYPGMIDFGHNNCFIGKFSIDILERDGDPRLSFGKNSLIRNEFRRNYFKMQHDGKIKIGDNVYINGAFIYSFKEVEIEDNVMIGWGTEIIDTDAHPIDKKHKVRSEKITIKKNAWISTKSTVLKGVTIGEGAVVGAGSVVVDDVKPHSLYAGNPARFIKKIGPR